MSLSWQQRKIRLTTLLKSQGDEDAEGVALDSLMNAQAVIGKTAKTAEVDALRFKESDLDVVGTLEYGQFGVIDVVTCHFNNCVYVRKTIEKRFALRTRDQCSPQFERDLLLQATKADSPWAPHLLCAFQSTTHLSIIMDYAEGGTLWDVLESSPHNGRVLESDLMWWTPQLVSAIHWCHLQGFAHRDIKPHNFVLTPDAHVLLIDFGSAAPLLHPAEDGTQLIPNRYCLVPCGTCDYISPEILQAHEEALVALEMDDDNDAKQREPGGYGAETDWWSLGAMLYEMAYGVAPFFANDIRQTYVRIMNHQKGLRFDQKVPISHEYQHFLRRLLTHANQRLGRRNVMEITDHPLFEGVDWTALPGKLAPAGLHLPQFTYAEPKPSSAEVAGDPIGTRDDSIDSLSQGFAFSAFFQSSSVSPGVSVLRPSPGANSLHPSLAASLQGTPSAETSFIGFSWGPSLYAFPEEPIPIIAGSELKTPRPLQRTPLRVTTLPSRYSPNKLSIPSAWMNGTPLLSTPRPMHAYATPLKPYALSPYATLPRTSTVRRTAPRRVVSDREAMKQLVECVGMSARKKVMESGRKPRLLSIFGSRESRSGTGNKRNFTENSGRSTLRKELRFDQFTTPIPGPDYSGANSSRSRAFAAVPGERDNTAAFNDTSDIYYHPSREEAARLGLDDDDAYPSSESTDSDGGGPPSPSPSPRPGSAMSVMSMTMMSRRSATPTVTAHFGSGSGMLGGRMRSGSLGSARAFGERDRSVNGTTTTISGLLSIPSSDQISLGRAKGRGEREVSDRLVQGGNEPASSTKAGRPDKLLFERRFSPTTAVPPPGLQTSSFASVPVPPHSSGTSFANVQKTPVHIRRRSSPPRPTRRDDDDDLPRDQNMRELERRHTLIMRDIEALEMRLEEVVSLVSRH